MRFIPSLRTTGILLSTAAGLLLVRPVSRWYETQAVDAWLRRLETAPAGEMPERLRLAGDAGEHSLDLLVAALQSPRAELSAAAHDALAARIDRRSAGQDPATPAQLASLVERLSRSIDRWPPQSQRWAANLVEQILELSPAWDVADRSAALAACQVVLSAAGALKEPAHPASKPVAQLTALSTPGPLVQSEATPAHELGKVPGGGLPMTLPLGTPSNSTAEIANPPREHTIHEYQSSGQNSTPPPRLLSPDPQGARPVPDSSQNPLRKPSTEVSPSETLRVSATAKANPSESLDDEALTVRWMHQLQSTDQSAVRRAEDELRQRGFGEFQVELARRLTHDNPVLRRQLAEAIPGMPQIDRKVWLIWLSRDEDADVRLTALSIMATSGDPELMKRVEQIARQDSDPRIQRQADKLQNPRR